MVTTDVSTKKKKHKKTTTFEQSDMRPQCPHVSDLETDPLSVHRWQEGGGQRPEAPRDHTGAAGKPSQLHGHHAGARAVINRKDPHGRIKQGDLMWTSAEEQTNAE